MFGFIALMGLLFLFSTLFSTTVLLLMYRTLGIYFPLFPVYAQNKYTKRNQSNCKGATAIQNIDMRFESGYVYSNSNLI